MPRKLPGCQAVPFNRESEALSRFGGCDRDPGTKRPAAVPGIHDSAEAQQTRHTEYAVPRSPGAARTVLAAGQRRARLALDTLCRRRRRPHGRPAARNRCPGARPYGPIRPEVSSCPLLLQQRPSGSFCPCDANGMVTFTTGSEDSGGGMGMTTCSNIVRPILLSQEQKLSRTGLLLVFRICPQ